MPDPPKDAKGIFLAAVDIADAAERAAFVERSCGDDAALRERVENLLRAYGQSGGPLDKLAAALAPTLPPAQRGPTDPRRAETLPGDRSQEKIGDVIAGRYKLVEALGEGGMGAVFMAQQTQPVKRVVALKLIKLGMDSKQVLARFEAERQALALMDHPNIAKVLDAGTTDSGRPFFVMELVKGVPITRFCDERQLSPRQRLELFIPVCQAIQHAHQKGIIHRDIKPTNVLVALYDDRPVPKVIDFGVAKAAGLQLTDASLVTGFGAIVGTPEYMSPEQAQLNQLDIDTRSDVYALGVLLYELLTGTTPIDRKRLGQGALFEVLRIIREEEPLRPSTRLSTSDALASIAATRATEPSKLAKLMRGELDWIVMKCLEKDRSRRYETANGLAHDLERYLADEPVEACPPSSTYRLRKLAGKYKKTLATAAAFVVLLAAGAVTSTLLAWWATSAEHEANRQRIASDVAKLEALHAKQEAVDAGVKERQQRQLAESERTRAVGAEAAAIESANEANRSRYASDIQLADQRFQHGDSVGADAVVQRYAARSGQKDLRGWEWYYQERLCHQEIRTFKGHAAVLKGKNDVNGITFSPDGKRLATAGSDGTVQIWDAATGEAPLTLKGHTQPVKFAVFSPDGKRLASAAPDYSIRIWNAQTGASQAVLHVPGVGVHALAFSPDGATLGSLDWKGEVRIWDPARGRTIHSVQPFGILEYYPVEGGLSVFSAAFSADLNRLANYGLTVSLMQGQTGLPIWDVTKGGTTKIKIPDADILTCLGFSPDGKWLATCAENAPISLWNAADAQASSRQLDGKIERGLSLAFSPDGALLACGEASGRVSLWQIRDGKLLRPFAGHSGPVKCLAFNFDGGRLASGSTDGTAKLWDTLGIRLRAVPQWDTRTVTIGYAAEWATGTIRQLFVKPKIAWPRETFKAQAVRVFSAAGTGGLEGIALSRSGRFIGAFDPRFGHREITIWDTRTAAAIELRPNISPDEVCRDLFFRPDDTCFAILEAQNHEGILSTGTSSLTVAPVTQDGVPPVKLKLPLVTGKPVERIVDVALNFEGTRIAAALARNPDSQMVAIWEVPSGRMIQSINDLHADELRFTRDGRLVARSGRRIYLRDISNHRSSEVFEGSLRAESDDIPESVPLAISPDDRLLAAADGGDITVWNLVSGKPLHTVHGGSVPIGCLALNPDGSRLVAGAGRILKLWDMTTGQELRSLTGHTGTINAVAFSSDGYRLISASDDRTVRVYDAQPLTPELQDETEASSLCESLAISASSEPDVIGRIDAYPGVADAPRRCAEEMAPRFWRAEINQRVDKVVDSLAAKLLLKSDLIESLRGDKSLSDEVRVAAMNRVSRTPEDPDRLNNESWKIGARSDASGPDYQLALRYAEEAVRLAPNNFDFVNTLGAAQYRVKKRTDAVASLSRSNEHHSKTKEGGGPQPADLAFLAMAHQALGHAAEAQAFLRQLTDVIKQEKWKSDNEAKTLFEEAKRSLATKP